MGIMLNLEMLEERLKREFIYTEQDKYSSLVLLALLYVINTYVKKVVTTNLITTLKIVLKYTPFRILIPTNKYIYLFLLYT